MDSEEFASFATAGGADPVAHFAKVVSALNPQSDELNRAAVYLQERTRSQALSGFDVNNRPFAPYSPLYAKKKGDAHVDLYSRGGLTHMLDAVEGRISLDPPAVEVGIFNNAELALRARVHNEGLVMFGGKAAGFIASIKHRSRQKIAGLKRQLRNKGGIKVIPKREWLKVTRQDLHIMAEMVGQAVVQRMKGVL